MLLFTCLYDFVNIYWSIKYACTWCVCASVCVCVFVRVCVWVGPVGPLRAARGPAGGGGAGAAALHRTAPRQPGPAAGEHPQPPPGPGEPVPRWGGGVHRHACVYVWTCKGTGIYIALLSKALHSIAWRSPIHAHSHTDGGVDHARRRPALREQLGLCVSLRDTSTLTARRSRWN